MRKSSWAIGLIAIVLVACSAGEAGMGLPQQISGETYPGDRREMSGVLEVADNGCLEVSIDGEPHFVIWPAGSQLENHVRLPNGEEIGQGDVVVGTGAFTRTAPLVGNGDGYWANTIGFCAPGASEVVVFDSARRLP